MSAAAAALGIACGATASAVEFAGSRALDQLGRIEESGASAHGTAYDNAMPGAGAPRVVAGSGRGSSETRALSRPSAVQAGLRAEPASSEPAAPRASTAGSMGKGLLKAGLGMGLGYWLIGGWMGALLGLGFMLLGKLLFGSRRR